MTIFSQNLYHGKWFLWNYWQFLYFKHFWRFFDFFYNNFKDVIEVVYSFNISCIRDFYFIFLKNLACSRFSSYDNLSTFPSPKSHTGKKHSWYKNVTRNCQVKIFVALSRKTHPCQKSFKIQVKLVKNLTKSSRHFHSTMKLGYAFAQRIFQYHQVGIFEIFLVQKVQAV